LQSLARGNSGGSVRVIADASDRCIEDQDVIDRIQAHLRDKEQVTPTLPHLAPPPRAPPETFLFSLEGNPIQQHSISKEASAW
jgi:hypothetical protein